MTHGGQAARTLTPVPDMLAGLDRVLITEALEDRPARSPDFEAEARALAVLGRELAVSPRSVLQRLVDLIVEMGMSGSAGISILKSTGGVDAFHWDALAGLWAEHLGGIMPFDESPCGVVVSRDTYLLFSQPHMHFPAANVEPLIHEILLVPFRAGDKPAGTLWVSSHDAGRTFDGEDLRLLTRLADFASASYVLTGALDEARAARQDLERRVADRTRALRESDDHHAFLLRLSDLLRPLGTPGDIAETAARQLSEHLDINRACYGEIRGGRLRIERDHVRNVPSIVGDYPLDAFNREFLAAYRVGEVVTVDDVEADARLDDAARAELRSRNIAAYADVVLLGDSEGTSILCAQHATPRVWTDAERLLVRSVGERVRSAIERSRAEEALRDSEARLSQFGEASSDVLWMRDAVTFQWVYLTPAFETIYGLDRTAALSGDNMMGWADLIVPEDRERAVENLQRVGMGERVSFEYRVRRPIDGEIRWLRDTDFPMSDASGTVRWIGGVGRDITEEMENAAHMSVLVDELQHRTRNLMGVVRATSDKTLRHSLDLKDFKARFGTRLAALSRVQGLLSRLAEGERITFDDLIRSEVAALDGEGTRIALQGPSGVALRSSTLQTFALAVHELATNAVKYGALAQSQAKLEIHWHVENAEPEGGAWLHVDWRERDVLMPANAGKPGSGSGRELIERALPYQLGARTTYVMEADGIHCTIALPVSGRTFTGKKADA